ncbi:PH domain-containing protein [Nocardioides pakistanensis]
MGETLTYRSGFSRGLAVVAVSLAAALLVWLAVTDPPAALRYAGPVGLVAALAWLGFWRPAVEVSDGGVQLRNVWRTVHVPWPALQDVDSRLGLRLVTAYGSFQAWAVPAPRRTRGGGPVAPSQAATWVVERWDQLKAAGYLDRPRLEQPRAHTTLHTGALALCTGLLALSVVGALVS